MKKLLSLALVCVLILPATNIFASSLPSSKYIDNATEKFYEDEDYQGILEPYVIGGDYVPAESKIVEAQNTANYEDELGFKGTLVQYVFSGSEAGSKQVTDQPSALYNDGTYSGTLMPDKIIGQTQLQSKYVIAQNQMSYTDAQGYYGSLEKYVYSGELTEYPSKYISAHTTMNYSDADGYSGSLEPYVYSGNLVPADSYFYNVSSTLKSDTTSYKSQTHSYTDSNGYTGNVTSSLISWSSATCRDSEGSYSCYNLVIQTSGTLTKPAVDTRVYRYKGNVNKPPIDTRTYKYRGTVYKDPEPIYSYKGTVTKGDDRVYKFKGTVIKPAIDTRTYGYKGFVRLKYKPTAPTPEPQKTVTVPLETEKDLKNNETNVVIPLPIEGDYYKTSTDGSNWSDWIRRPSNTNDIKIPVPAGEGEKSVFYQTGNMRYKKTPVYDGFTVIEAVTDEKVFEPASEVFSIDKTIDITPPQVRFKTENNMYVFKTSGLDQPAVVKVVVDVTDNLDKEPDVKINVFKSDSQGMKTGESILSIDGKRNAKVGTLNLVIPGLCPLIVNGKIQPYHLELQAIDNHGNTTLETVQIYVKP